MELKEHPRFTSPTSKSVGGKYREGSIWFTKFRKLDALEFAFANSSAACPQAKVVRALISAKFGKGRSGLSHDISPSSQGGRNFDSLIGAGTCRTKANFHNRSVAILTEPFRSFRPLRRKNACHSYR